MYLNEKIISQSLNQICNRDFFKTVDADYDNPDIEFECDYYYKPKMVTVFFLSLMAFFSVKAQEDLSHKYRLIEHVIGQDTIPDEVVGFVFHREIVNGNRTKQDSIDYVSRWKDNSLILMKNAVNKYARECLTKDYLNTQKISQYLGKEALLKIVESIGPDQNHREIFLAEGISVLIEKPRFKPHHYFSNSFPIEKNKYIIYHFKKVGRGVGISEFIIYCVHADGNIKIEKSFVLWEH